MRVDPNKRAPNPGTMISGSGDGRLTVGDIRDAIHNLDDDVEIISGSMYAGKAFSSVASNGEVETLGQIELNEEE